ncbi:hypothetical protein A1D17_03440 [Pseudomonas fluorescens]|uniref:Uncharacterized protein n=2 Tax=Pseudomonas TaxID=286 RepID=A0A162B2A1_PSEFL|nr:hypothetical protein A1D17_03440 [Pseudomonas fluorescens]
MYLKVLSGSMIELVQYYFTQWSPYHAALRGAAVAIIFSGGLAWMGILILRAPMDRLKGVVGAGVILVLCAIFLSSSDKSSTLYMGSSAKGGPVANGSYWSYTVIGNIYSVMKSGIDTVFNSELAEYYGGIDGPSKQKLMIAYDDAAERNAKAFEGSPAYDIYLDYMTKCNKAVLDSYGVKSNQRAFKGVGLMASTRIAIDERDTSVLTTSAQLVKKKAMEDVQSLYASWREDNDSWAMDEVKLAFSQVIGGVTGGTAGLIKGVTNPVTLGEDKADGEAALKAIPDERNPFNGKSVGYLIPSKAYWDKKNNLPASGSEFLDSRTDLGGNYTQAGIQEDKPLVGGESGEGAEVKKFYPKNCYDAYKLSSEAIKAWRDSNVGNPAYKDATVAGAFMQTSAGQRVGERGNEEVKRRILAAGGTVPANGLGDDFASGADAAYSAGIDVYAEIAEFMLRYKVPMTILTVAMMAAALLVAFPLFCVMAVFMGPGILWTYLKLISLCFLVAFLNDLFLGMAANVISANSLSMASDAGYIPGAGSLANDMAASGSKAVIFSALTVLELVFAKLLLWDDVKAIGSFNPGSIGVDAASSGLAKVGSAALAVATLGRSAIAGGAAGSAVVKSTTSAVSQFGKSVNNVSQIMSSRPKSTGGFASSAVKATADTTRALSSLVPKKPSGGGKGGNGKDGGKPKP